MGLAYSKENEGSLYPNTTTGEQTTSVVGDALAPGECYVYKWLVNDGSAPYPGTNSQMWSYRTFCAAHDFSFLIIIIPFENGSSWSLYICHMGFVNR